MNTPDTTSSSWQSQLLAAQTIAIVGCSEHPWRTSYHIAQYLQRQGYRILPINPNITSCLGEAAFPDLKSLPEDLRPEIINVFRNAQYAVETVEMIIDYARSTNTQPLIWTQLGVSTPTAKQKALEAGLPYVTDRCIMVEHQLLKP